MSSGWNTRIPVTNTIAVDATPLQMGASVVDQIDAPLSKSECIVSVCEREIGALTERINQSACSAERSKLLAQRADVLRLRAFAVSQRDFLDRAANRPCTIGR